MVSQLVHFPLFFETLVVLPLSLRLCTVFRSHNVIKQLSFRIGSFAVAFSHRIIHQYQNQWPKQNRQILLIGIV